MELKLNRNLDNNIPTKLTKNIIKSEKPYPVCFAVFSMLRRPSLKTKFISNRVPFLPPTEPCRWNVGTNSRSNLGTSTKMCPAGEIHGKPLARNKPHTPPLD